MKTINELIGNLGTNFDKVFDKLSNYIFPNTKILVAVSGGPDSMLLSILIFQFFKKKHLNLDNLIFVHCNHKTRPETDSEEKFIRGFFDGLNLKVFVYDGDSHKEDELRQWRYLCFNQIVQSEQIQYLATGHNLTDRIESTFLNMLRGSGMNGFLSMRFVDQNNLLEGAQIIRPLLSFTKKEIEQYCLDLQIPFAIDQTNLDKNTSMRNYMRLELLPKFAEKSNKTSDFTCTFFESMKQVYSQIESLETADNIGNFVAIRKSGYRNADFAFLREIPFGFIDEKVILTVLKKFNIYSDISKNTLSDFLNFFQNSSQGYKYINGVYFFISNGKIYIIKAKQNFWEKNIEKDIIIDSIGDIQIGKETIKITDSKLVGCTLRYPKIGDRVGTKSRSEYCINKKVPTFWRNFIPVVQLPDGNIQGFLDQIL